MDGTADGHVIKSPWEAWIRRGLALSRRRPWWILLGVLALTVGAFPFAISLKVSTNLKKLLPEDSPAVVHMNEASAKLGDLGYFSLIIENDNTDESFRFANAYVERIRESKYVRTVLHENPVEFLRRTRFLLLSVMSFKKSKTTF